MKIKVGGKVMIRDDAFRGGDVGTVELRHDDCETYDWKVHVDEYHHHYHSYELIPIAEPEEPTKPKAYTILKPVSIKSLENAGGSCPEFKRGLADAAILHLRGHSMGCSYTSEIYLEGVIAIAEQIPNAIKFLIDKGFIEEKVEFKPVTVTLKTQNEVDGLFALCNHTELMEIAGVERFKTEELLTHVRHYGPFHTALCEVVKP